MCKIVIVDDSKEIRDDLESSLKELFTEHTIFSFEGTNRALESAKTLEFVDIVFFNNLYNKNPNGVEFAKVIREKSPGTMLIYISDGQRNYDHMMKLSAIGIDGVIEQPCNRDCLKYIISNSISRINSLNSFKSQKHLVLEKSVDNFLAKFSNAVEQKNSSFNFRRK